jgi:hypothetical protein
MEALINGRPVPGLILSADLVEKLAAARDLEIAEAVDAFETKWKRRSWRLALLVGFLGVGLHFLGLPLPLALVAGANGFYITNVVARNMLKAAGSTLATNFDAGTAAVIELYDGTVPADADASEANVLLGSLTCSATCFVSDSDANPGGRVTFDTITNDSSADATGTCTHGRIKTQTAGTVVAQFTVGTATADLILNTTSITSGSTLSITSGTITLPEGP